MQDYAAVHRAAQRKGVAAPEIDLPAINSLDEYELRIALTYLSGTAPDAYRAALNYLLKYAS